jgi:rhodanese-related sulfurtransferase
MQDIFIFIQHHWLLSIAFTIVLLALLALEFIKIKRGTLQVSPQEAILLINHENAVVVDVRALDAYINGHIINAISLPLSEIETKHKKLDKFKTNPILITCAAGLESSAAADSLTKHGFNVRVLAGGMRSWKDAEMPLVKGN